MNKQIKERISYVILFIFVFILPNLFILYTKSENRADFYERVREDQETCLQRTERDSVEGRWCGEIKAAAVLSYNSARDSDNLFFLMILFQPLLFVLIINIGNLRKQIADLKEKIDA